MITRSAVASTHRARLTVAGHRATCSPSPALPRTGSPVRWSASQRHTLPSVCVRPLQPSQLGTTRTPSPWGRVGRQRVISCVLGLFCRPLSEPRMSVSVSRGSPVTCVMRRTVAAVRISRTGSVIQVMLCSRSYDIVGRNTCIDQGGSGALWS